MSSRRVISAKAPGTAIKPKSSLLASNVRPSPNEGHKEVKEDSLTVYVWWKENAEQFSTILRHVLVSRPFETLSPVF